MKRRNGFTLVELLSVIVIIVLLVSIFLPSVQNVQRQANSVACQSNLWNEITFSPIALYRSWYRVELVLISPDGSYILNLWICDNTCTSDTCLCGHCWTSHTCINESEDNIKEIVVSSLLNQIEQKQSAR